MNTPFHSNKERMYRYIDTLTGIWIKKKKILWTSAVCRSVILCVIDENLSDKFRFAATNMGY